MQIWTCAVICVCVCPFCVGLIEALTTSLYVSHAHTFLHRTDSWKSSNSNTLEVTEESANGIHIALHACAYVQV